VKAASSRALIDALIEAVWLVEPVNLLIIDMNQSALDLSGLARNDMMGRPVVELTGALEDQYFWEDVAAGLSQSIHSETLIRSADGIAIPVERKVSRIWLDAATPLFMVVLRDLRQQRRIELQLEHMVAELRATLESTADGILSCDSSGRVQNYNRRFAELFDLPEALMVRRNDPALFAHLAAAVTQSQQYQERLAEIVSAPLLEAEDVFTLRSGHTLERRSRPQYNRGQPTGRVYAFRDISQQVEVQARLRLAAKVFDSSLDAIFITSVDFVLMAVNPACERQTGLPQARLLGSAASEFFFDPHDQGFFSRIQQHLTTDGFWEGEVWRRNHMREPHAVQVSWVLLRDEVGTPVHSVCFFKDLSEKYAAQQRIETLAYRDVLTGLPNRLLLSQRVDFALRMAERNGGQFAVFFLDLDRFKNINDSMGHSFGDRVLVEVASRIGSCLRDVDTLCRLGGDEFVLFLQEADAPGAEACAQRVLQAIAEPFVLDGMNFSVGCSIGVALYPDDGKTLDKLIQYADTAMYRVKDRGRGSFRFYQPQMNVDVLSRIKMHYAMRQGMQKGNFRIHYQPQIDIASGRLIGAEALSRWTDAEFGEVPPNVFIQLAEETGFITTIGSWALDQAVRQAALWQQAGTPLVVSINVSALQFQQADFVEVVGEVLRSAGLAPELLELELTESILVRDADEALERLHALAAIGVGLSIDDFGTGYSSLSYLKRFPIGKLKIDRSFVTGLPGDDSDRAIVSATIAMARALKLSVVAEGVETQAQMDCLRELDCAAYQGFLCSAALPPAEFSQWMAAQPGA
jgi:diguanylate cyclase (GGDEF)-like protein/PAS domain S-box-containing protein